MGIYHTQLSLEKLPLHSQPNLSVILRVDRDTHIDAMHQTLMSLSELAINRMEVIITVEAENSYRFNRIQKIIQKISSDSDLDIKLITVNFSYGVPIRSRLANDALLLIKGTYFAVLDCVGVIYPGAYSKLLSTLSQSDGVAAIASCDIMNAKKNKNSMHVDSEMDSRSNFGTHLYSCIFNRTKIPRHLQFFSEYMPIDEEQEFLHRLASFCKIDYSMIEIPVFNFFDNKAIKEIRTKTEFPSYLPDQIEKRKKENFTADVIASELHYLREENQQLIETTLNHYSGLSYKRILRCINEAAHATIHYTLQLCVIPLNLWNKKRIISKFTKQYAAHQQYKYGCVIYTCKKNGRILQCLDTIRKSSISKDILFVIVNDQNDTVSQVVGKHEELNVIELKIRNHLGALKGILIGWDTLQKFKVKYLLSLSENVCVEKNWLINIIELLDINPRAIVTGLNTSCTQIAQTTARFNLLKDIPGVDIAFLNSNYPIICQIFRQGKYFKSELKKVIETKQAYFLSTKYPVLHRSENKTFISNRSIPAIIHQTWIDEDIPKHLQFCVDSVKKHNKDFKYLFWTDNQLDEFVRNEFPEIYFYYCSMEFVIQKIDLVRLLILYQYGGIYLDLDFYCSKNLSPLLVHNNFFSKEKDNPAFDYHFIISNAVIGAEKGSSFIAFLIQKMIEHIGRESDVNLNILKSTGPLFLTDYYLQYPHLFQVTLYEHPYFFPVCLQTIEKEGFNPKMVGADAYGAHIFNGSWWKEGPPKKNIPISLKAHLFPLVSCLMASRSSLELLKISVECFKRQTYPNRELLIYFDLGWKTYEENMCYIQELNDPKIKVFTNNTGMILGELRNDLNSLAEGSFVIQWDDDDYYHPNRIELMLASLFDKSDLATQRVLWCGVIANDFIGFGKSLRREYWEGSSIYRKEIAISTKYGIKKRGEDTEFLEQVINRKIVGFEHLYLYTYTGENVFDFHHHVFHLTENISNEMALAYKKKDFQALERIMSTA